MGGSETFLSVPIDENWSKLESDWEFLCSRGGLQLLHTLCGLLRRCAAALGGELPHDTVLCVSDIYKKRVVWTWNVASAPQARLFYPLRTLAYDGWGKGKGTKLLPSISLFPQGLEKDVGIWRKEDAVLGYRFVVLTHLPVYGVVVYETVYIYNNPLLYPQTASVLVDVPFLSHGIIVVPREKEAQSSPPPLENEDALVDLVCRDMLAQALLRSDLPPAHMEPAADEAGVVVSRKDVASNDAIKIALDKPKRAFKIEHLGGVQYASTLSDAIRYVRNYLLLAGGGLL